MNMSKITVRVPWSDEHVNELLGLYFQFLTCEQAGEAYTKAKPVRELAASQGRSKGSVEAKMMNVSAVLNERGQPWVNGYKPLGHGNKALADQVLAYLAKRG